MENTEQFEEKKLSLFDREALEATKTHYITHDNAEFVNHDGFITMKSNGEETRVILHLLFPYDEKTKLVSVLNESSAEIGMISDIEDFQGESLLAIKKELERKYFLRKIVEILEIKDKRGVTTWKVHTSDLGEDILEFSIKDTYGSIYKLTDNRLIINDMDGNKYEIADVTKLPKESYRKIELYL